MEQRDRNCARFKGDVRRASQPCGRQSGSIGPCLRGREEDGDARVWWADQLGTVGSGRRLRVLVLELCADDG